MEHYLGEKLKNLRESRNWSQAELAKRLNKAVSTISGYEEEQCNLLRKIRQEYLSPSQRGKDFSKNQMDILHDIISSFG